uniref:glutathione-specific gamma-glutamylcyclotransferase n=2 Tax=Parascaris univalens TaxID=6257 RepID=A0A915BV05_PARUN
MQSAISLGSVIIPRRCSRWSGCMAVARGGRGVWQLLEVVGVYGSCSRWSGCMAVARGGRIRCMAVARGGRIRYWRRGIRMWVFGYGSLLWYTDFPYDEAIPGCVHGYSRRFWQLSPDHRGTPQKPGRTVTLVADESGSCWGLAYKLRDSQIHNTIEYLDVREKAGYVRQEIDFYPDDGSSPFSLHAYLAAAHSNPYFTGPVDNDVIIQTILTARGPSGTNLEYALRLADCVRRMAPHIRDEHLFAIEKKLLEKCRALNVHDQVLSDLGIAVGVHSTVEDETDQRQ